MSQVLRFNRHRMPRPIAIDRPRSLQVLQLRYTVVLTGRLRFMGLVAWSRNMRAIMRGIFYVALLGLLPLIARADDVTEFPGFIRQNLQLPVSTPDGISTTLEALVLRPIGPGPFPLVLISHGTNRLAKTFPSERPEIYINPALVFAQRGYAAVVVMRRGFGRSTGPYAEDIGACDDKRNYLGVAQAASDQILAALSVLRREAWVDSMRVLLLGHSTGGIASLAASSISPKGVLGVISFAGGNGSARPDYVCQPDHLIEADRILGRETHIPSLWIYSENDHFFGPDLARKMFAAYTENDAPATFFEAPPWANEGHSFIWAPDGIGWWPQVATFLKTLRLPTNIVVPLSLPHVAPPASLDDAGRAAFEQYLQSFSYEKSFAVAINAAGHWGWVFSERARADARNGALKDCQKLDRVCQVYAIGNDLSP